MKRSTAVVFLVFLAYSVVLAYDCLASPGIIPVSNFTSPALPAGIPDGWKLEKKTGQSLINMHKDGEAFYLHLISRGDSSFGLRKETRVDVKTYPILCWRWKVTVLPKGDVRKAATDDQAAQIYVAFKESGFMGLNTPIIGYIWDNDAPKGWSGRSTQTGGDKIRYIVLRNKSDNIGQWYTEKRNVYQDYKRLFADINGGEPQGSTTGLQIHINSQHTKSPAESMIGDIYFSNEPADITFAASGAPTAPAKVARISAVKPPVIAKSRPGKLTRPDCFSAAIEFDTDSIIIEENFLKEMQAAADYLLQFREETLNVVGHTDNVGSEEYNLALSRRRAQSVSNYLAERFDIDPKRLNVQGEGPRNPAADNNTPEGRRKNRNVMISNCPE